MTEDIEKLKADHRLALAKNDSDKIELLACVLRLVEAAKPHCVPTSRLNMRVNEAVEMIEKHTFK